MDTTTAIIQFIGIVLFSSQVPNDPGVHAILPKIGHAEHVHYLANPKPDANATGVEDHVAAIIYRERDRLHRVGGWKKDGDLKSDWEYVLLRGEHVQFLTNSANAEPMIPAALPRAAAPSSCPTVAQQTKLSPSFQAPYRGAAGVF